MPENIPLTRARKTFEDMITSIAGETPDDVRKAYDDMCSSFNVPADIEEETVDANGVPSLLVGAPGTSHDRIIVFIHGGGLMIGTAGGYRGLGYALSSAGDARVLLPDYRLAPENPFPAAFDDAQSALRWAIDRVGSKSVVVAGDSAGGGMAIVATRALKESGAGVPAGAVLYSPWADWTASSESHQRNKEVDPVVSAEMVSGMTAAYLQNGEDPADPRVSALFGDLSGLPPVIIFAGTAELLEDETRLLAQRIEEAGGQVELHVEKDLVHVYPVFHEFLPEAEEAVSLSGEFVRAATSVGVA